MLSNYDPMNMWYQWAPSRLFGQDFGMPLTDAMGMMVPFSSRAWNMQNAPTEVINEKNRYAVNIDCSHFRPEEIEVKMANDRLVIHAKHNERMDPHGYISREFTRQYTIPKDIQEDTWNSHFDNNGILTVEAKKKAAVSQNERIIPITYGGRKPEIKCSHHESEKKCSHHESEKK
uniref:SHSP domain-containing protein n=1 Tax=Trichuris muris TaxID=70415 RepID=A0A5S6QCK3_TRIMR